MAIKLPLLVSQPLPRSSFGWLKYRSFLTFFKSFAVEFDEEFFQMTDFTGAEGGID